jgi:hypothetical protein
LILENKVVKLILKIKNFRKKHQGLKIELTKSAQIIQAQSNELKR